MKADLQTIFSKLTSHSSEEAENKKISYWLEKLFHQEEEKIKREKKEKSLNQNAVSESNPPENATGTNLSTEEKGIDEALKNHARKTENNRQSIENMVSDSNRILISISSVFPWDFFPTTINVESTRITIIYRQLFSSQVHSVDIKDVSNIFLETGILFATITIISRTFVQNDVKIGKLWKKDAILVRRIIEGLRMFIKENIDTTTYSVDDLIKKLKELSTTKIVL